MCPPPTFIKRVNGILFLVWWGLHGHWCLSDTFLCARILMNLWAEWNQICQNFVSAQYYENELTEFHQIVYMHSYWQDLANDYYTSFFAKFVPKLCSLIYDGYFVHAQYFENKSTECHQILYIHWYWQDLTLDCYTSFSADLYQS